MKWNGYVLAAAFLAGIVLANLWGKEFLTTYGIFNTYFLSQYAYAQIDYQKLLGQIVWVRGKEIAAILILEKFFRTKVVLLLLEFLLAFSIGFLLVAAIENRGICGILIVIMGIFPQWLFYLLAGVIFFAAQWKMASYGKQIYYSRIFGNIGAMMLFLLGIVTEVYLHPVLCQQILKKF